MVAARINDWPAPRDPVVRTVEVTDWIVPEGDGNPALAGLHPWLAFLMEPWLDAILRAAPGSTGWLREASAAMSDCLLDWVDPDPTIERALEAARAASDVLAASIDRAPWADIETQRRMASAAMSVLIDALRRAAASTAKAGQGLRW